MTLHRLNQVIIGVPDVARTSEFYRDFNLSESAPGVFSTADGGEQLRLVHSPVRRLLGLEIGADDPDDLQRVARQIQGIGVPSEEDGRSVTATDPGTGVEVKVAIAPRIRQVPAPAPLYNGPGRVDRQGRSPRLPDGPEAPKARPRKLGHVVVGTTDPDSSNRFFREGIGFKISDEVKGAAYFLRCSEDHHNLLVQRAPIQFLHHTSWQVEDVDEIGLGAQSLLSKDPSRHVWGFGRHHIGSNFFWYFRDPAGNFAEYYSDMDCVLDDQLWKPQVWEGMHALYAWGPPPPPSFLRPDDLAELMAGSHPARA
jgi:catechol 2,3-dioxygenase-like lactoylglutathione lyase family enzyme